MKITIMGTPGSGKSTLAKDLSEVLKMKYYSAGNMRRDIAKKHGITLAELNKLAEKEFWTDEEVDKFVEKLGKEEDNIIVEGRLAWHFIPDSVKIFLDADETLRAERMLKRKLEEESFEEINEAVKANKERLQGDIKRYKQYYNLDPYDLSHYDIVLDSTGKKPETSVRETLDELKKRNLIKP